MPSALPTGTKTSETTRFDERTTIAERASRATPRRIIFARRPAPAARSPMNPFAVPDDGQALRTAVELAVLDEREALRTADTQAAVDVREELRGDPVEFEPEEVDTDALFEAADEAAHRIATRRARTVRKAKLRVLRQAQAAAEAKAGAEAQAQTAQTAQTAQARTRAAVAPQRVRHVDRARRHLRSVVTKHTTAVKVGRRTVRVGNGMTAVITFARSQIGKRYVTGGMGQGGFDCSGLTKRAYALAGIRLPHSSGAQAARSRSVSRSAARAGDLVVGPGHVGIYMGRGMMIDAGNHRTGVVYRKVYAGLRVARIGS